MNQTKSAGPLKAMCYVALLFLGLLCFAYAYQMYWHRGQVVLGDDELSTYRLFLFWGTYVSKFLLFLCCALFAVFQLRGVRRGELFPRVNVPVINVVAVLSFLASVFSKNVKEAYLPVQESLHGTFELDDSALSILLLLLVFGQVYRIASRVAQENELTI